METQDTQSITERVAAIEQLLKDEESVIARMEDKLAAALERLAYWEGFMDGREASW